MPRRRRSKDPHGCHELMPKNEYRPTLLTEEGKKQLAQLEELEKVFNAEAAKVVAAVKAGDVKEADDLSKRPVHHDRQLDERSPR